MSRSRQHNVTGAQWKPASNGDVPGMEMDATTVFNSNVFTDAVAKKLIDSASYDQFKAALAAGEPIGLETANAVAAAMMNWAIGKGATHYTHWFQPLTGKTAEKHDSFYEPTDQKAIASFKGKDLIQAEPDASSFPSGGIRATFEARGYTAWDPTSPAFILENPNGATLCIPTAFVSWTGEALDTKIPLLRSMAALSDAAVSALRLFGDDDTQHVFTTAGAEQEYFLIPEHYYFERPDLVTTGRTLFGAKPPKGHELDDHYFGSIPQRVLACMMEFEYELAKVGVPIKTRHNEVAPAQYEVAPIFENSNLSADHQQLTMQTMQNVARNYGLICLLHEKPFAGVNGSGKHNNWSMGTDTGANLLSPGDDPHDNLKFLFFCTAVIAAVNKHQGLLRATVASAGNDHRLGANEAPPAIISIYLGDLLQDIFDQIAKGAATSSKDGGILELGSPVLPPLPADAGDRNRTSPFAFTGAKFEFRALGSNQSISDPNTVLNTIVAESVKAMTGKLEAAINDGASLEDALGPILTETYNANKAIVFNGDNYTDEWHAEAEQRGLKNLRTTPEALQEWITPRTVETFGNFNVLSERELHSRFDVYIEQYVIKVNIEAETAYDLARSMLMPAAIRYLGEVKNAAPTLADDIEPLVTEFNAAIKQLEEANLDENHPTEIIAEADYMRDSVIPAINAVRAAADKLERVVADDLWPLPKYSEILFIK
ncbi:MAG: glutamine synthetase III [Thermoleophilia bacterium]|nr:glutamine synthetase III [Thermoleophilia bacterium]